MKPGAAFSEAAAALLAEIESSGVRATLRDGKLVLAPRDRLGPELRDRVRPNLKPLIELLERRDSAPAECEALPALRPRVSCERRRFPEWSPKVSIRFCCEPSHDHRDGVSTYDSEEIAYLLDWCARQGVSRLPISLRDALLDLKVMFGGRIDLETLSPMKRSP